MPTKHHLSSAEKLYYGAGYFAPMQGANERNGVPINFLTKLSLGSPIAPDPNGLVDAATGTEIPDAAETVSYTTANDGASPFDNVDTPAVSSVVVADGSTQSVWALDVPRNISLNVTHASSIVAMSCTVHGYDAWGQAMSETVAVTATGTSKTTAGKKAFKYIKKIDFTAASDASANTANLGWADVLGLPYKAAAVADVPRVYFNDILDDSATVVKADTTTATATTGDVRGTVDPNSACDASEVVVWMHIDDPNTEKGLRGIDQYAA